MNCLLIGLALSMHIGLQNDYNHNHPYVMCEKDEIVAGAYYNSLDRWSGVLAKKVNISDDLYVDVGLATGYYKDVVPLVRVRYKNMFVMPALEDERTGVVAGIQFDFKLK